TAAARDDLASRRGIPPELALTRRLRKQLLRLLDSELVGDDVVGDVRALLAALEVRAVAPDAHDDVALGNEERVDLARVDRAEVLDEVVQAGRAVAEVEAVQPAGPLLLAAGDAVEVVFHRRGEAVVDEPAEVLFEQLDDREREERRHERRALLEDVAAVENGADDRRVGRRS